MACRAIHGWTLCSLVGAYLDLALAYLLLCGSTIAFIAAKFLAIVGLELPCSCDGLFGRPHPPGDPCLQGLLVHCPATKIAAVQNLVRSRFPFDSILENRCENNPSCFDVKFVTDNSNRLLEMDELELSRSVSHGRLTLPSPSPSPGFESESSSRPRSVLRRRRRTFVPRRKLLACAQQDISEGSSSPADFTVKHNDRRLREKDGGSVDKDVHVSELSEAEVIKKLENALEEEQEAYAALCLELEKERSAAATSADEAMAMILRLQEEKAGIEMEARQYRRMSEEKSAYDEEEMEILKEIIVRREREKHVLEKELEAYRQMMFSDESFQKNLSGDVPDIVPPVEQKLQIDESSFGKEGDSLCVDKDWMDHGLLNSTSGLGNECFGDSEGSVDCLVAVQVHSDGKLQDSGDVYNEEAKEKGKARADVCPYSAETQWAMFEGTSSITCAGDDKQKSDNPLSVPFDVLYEQNSKMAGQGCNASTHTEFDSSVYDVHVIDDSKQATGHKRNRKHSDIDNILRDNDPRIESSGNNNTDCSNICSITNWGVPEGIHRSCSESEMGGQLTDSQPNMAPYKLRGSMSAVDSERLKLEIEVELLRKRLKAVQQGREKLSISSDRREKEDFQLQLLEEISSQLREIRKTTEPVKGARRASLPPQFSKVLKMDSMERYQNAKDAFSCTYNRRNCEVIESKLPFKTYEMTKRVTTESN